MEEVFKTDSHQVLVFKHSVDDSGVSKEKKKLLDRLSKIRSREEKGGVDYNGIIIKTDEGSLGKITSTIMALQSGMMSSIDWKGHNGWIKNVDQTIMLGIATTVSAHVQKCFTTEHRISEKILDMSETDAKNLNLNDLWDSYFTAE